MKASNKSFKAHFSRNIRTNRGFTLVEVVIAIAILTVIGTITYSALTQILRSKNILDDRRELNAVAYSILNRMTRELQLAYSGIGLMPRPDEPEGKQLSSSVNMIGESKTLAAGTRGDSVRFLALEGGQYLPDGGTHSGLVQLMYRVEENPDTKDTQNPTYVLVREETPLIRPFEKAFTKIMIFPIVESLIGLEFRYMESENNQWLTTWDPDKNFGLPAQVEIRIKLRSPRGEEHSFITTVPLRSINVVNQSIGGASAQ